MFGKKTRLKYYVARVLDKNRKSRYRMAILGRPCPMTAAAQNKTRKKRMNKIWPLAALLLHQ